MSLRWKNAVVSGADHTVARSYGRVSKTQRKYKVRFQSDIRSARKPRSRHDAEESASTSSPMLTEEDDCNNDKTSTSSLPSTRQGEDDEADIRAGSLGSINENSNDKQDADSISILSAATMQDASLLYAFSTEHCVREQTDELITTLSPLPGSPSQASHQTNFEEDRLSAGGHGGCLEPLMQKPASQTKASSPQLTFQADILPNIPRQLPFVSTWSEGHSSKKRMYLQYYIEKVVPRLMPLWDSADNPFLCIVIPASTESEILMHAIMALSSYHLSVQPNNGRDGLAEPGRNKDGHSLEVLRHKQKVLALLRENLAKPDILRDDATLAACMLMQTFEVLFCGTSGWDHWLKGATLLLRLRGRLESDLKDSNSWIRLAKCVVAIETFASTSTPFELLISEEYWNIYRRIREDYLQSMSLGQSSGLNEYSEDEHFEKLVGCPVVVVYSLGRMVMLRQSREEMEQTSGTYSDAEWHSTWSIESIKLEHLLFRWRPKDSTPDRANLTEAFRQAALVFYYRRIRRLSYSHETVQHHVQRTFKHLELISPSSKVVGIALWPTMIAAIEIDEVKNPGLTQLAIKRIRGLSKNIRDPLYQNAQNALNLLWSRRRDAATWEERMAVDWDKLSKEMDWQWCFV